MMKITPREASTSAFGQTGVFRGHIHFENPTLSKYAWPLCDIRGAQPGPRLCVTAGVHVNEVSSMEAAVRLQSLFDPQTMRGTVSIIPLVNLPAYGKFTQYNCPEDDKNINFTFPGDPKGSFSEVLCDVLLNVWAEGAECYIDLHGGDLREKVSKFVMFQPTGEPELDAEKEKLARCFDAEIVMALPQKLLSAPGRAPTGFANAGRISIMSEAGANGIYDEESISFHVDGVLNIAAELGITDHRIQPTRAQILCNEYLWLESPESGQFHTTLVPGQAVTKGQILGAIYDVFGCKVDDVLSPKDALVLWRMTHPTAVAGSPLLALAIRAESPAS
ncbi:succinylglutamate desuccinylase/aspartoacylase family protein [Nitratireductor sp. GZWM139]|uniref:succinylglutamate desuccinylase/aspartoacylase domain-containing protein n=1 Tax=Nitratireductor sp. GZWM139 TaxID=2950541 RepID=UPI0024BD66BD|nr:succinylglutamate desuccinylase/aspartoacylase family protein [Nitratireductor sp. GZWM139]MDJ1466116.1 succinylglutamate desuccinylase/aspartoacylase family protein [Nitratireductor sp. GZWM139]